MSNETLVLDTIKDYQMEYPDGVPISILLELNLSDDDLKATLFILEGKGVIFIEEEFVKLVEQVSVDKSILEGKAVGKGSEINVSDKKLTIDEDKLEELTELELEAYRLIIGLTGDSKRISKYLLEGNLLYGDLELSSLGAFKLIMSLENKGFLKRIHLTDGEYYTI